MQVPYKAFLFDLNGTMIDDMDYHITAWHRILNELGASITWEQMKHECYGKNHELLERTFPGRFSEEEKDKMSFAKEEAYQAAFKPHLKLIKGLDDFLARAHASGLRMAIGSAAILFNIDFVLDNIRIRHYFQALVSADHVRKSKPDPETYLTCAKELGVHSKECLVFEDTPKGVESALNAGMDAVVIKGMHEEWEFKEYKNVVGMWKDFEGGFE
jgi:hypothetical protein